MKRYLDNKKFRIIFAGNEIKEEYRIVKVMGKHDYSYPETYSMGIYDAEYIDTYNQHGKIVQVEESVFKPLLEKHTIGYDVTFGLPTKRN